MFNPVTNNKFELDLQTIVRCQPIRLKTLLDSFKSDEEESEDTSCKSEDELDSDNSLLLPQDDPFKNALQESVTIDSVSKQIKDKFPKATCISPEESHNIATNKFSVNQDKIKCINEKEECKVSDVNTDKHLPIEDLNKPDFYNTVHKEKTQNDLSNILVSKKQQSNIIYNQSTIVVLPPPSVLIDKENYIKNFDTNKNTQVTNNAQLHYDDDHISDVLNKKKEEHKDNTSIEKKISLERNIKNYSLDLNKEDQQYKNMNNNFTEQTNKNSDEHCENNSTAGLEPTNCKPQTFGNLIHSAMSSQYNIMKQEANEKYTSAKNACAKFSTPLLKETGNSVINDLISETPLKHSQIDSTHSNACMPHKQLFQTPQNELSKSHVQTPSMIISSSSNNNMRYTPLENKKFIAKDYMQTPRNSVYTPITGKQESSRHFPNNVKNIRQPLVDTALRRIDSLTHSLELQTPVSHASSEPQDIALEIQPEDRNKKMVGLSSIKLIQTETNYDNSKHNLKLVKSTQEAKENKHPNMRETLLENNKQILYNKKDSENLMTAYNSNVKMMLDLPQKHKKENNIASNAECKDFQNPYLNHQKQQELKQITDKVANIQLTVPSSIPRQRQGKTLFVKDREYLIWGTLGRGMSGEVLRVQDVHCGESRAIKCVDLSKMDKESAQGCLDEISMLHKLQAPCIIRMFDYQIKESMVYVVMEMGDTDLSWLIKSISQEKQIPLTMILYYWTEMLTAVKHIHDNGVIHSDLKPANFLLVRGRLKLIDFGIASNINSDMTSVLKNNPIGTLNYISPEALMDTGENTGSPTHKVKYKISFKSDVWSLGCILYSLVYGHTPFHHIRSQWAKVNAITNSKTNISFPITEFSSGNSQHCERVPPVLIDVLRKCLQHDPKARPTVAELLQVQYVPTKQDVKSVSKSDLPANVLVKIKHALNEEEWRQFVEITDIKRHQYT